VYRRAGRTGGLTDPPVCPTSSTHGPRHLRGLSGVPTTVLVLGIVSIPTAFVLIGLVPAIIAVSVAPGARREITELGGRVSGLGMVTAGMVTGHDRHRDRGAARRRRHRVRGVGDLTATTAAPGWARRLGWRDGVRVRARNAATLVRFRQALEQNRLEAFRETST
jgi:hypothetical protein